MRLCIPGDSKHGLPFIDQVVCVDHPVLLDWVIFRENISKDKLDVFVHHQGDSIQQLEFKLCNGVLPPVCQHVLVHGHPLVKQVANLLVSPVQHGRIGHHVDQVLDVGRGDVLHSANIGVDDLTSLLDIFGGDPRPRPELALFCTCKQS